jgi:Interferon-induced transmembrane protein
MSDQWGPPPSGADIPNYMVWGIVAIFCCWPLAIFALMNATKVNGLVAAGDIAGATEASGKAKKFAMIAIIGGLIIQVLTWGIVGIMFAVGAIKS